MNPNGPAVPRGRAFQARVLTLSAAISIAAVLLISGYLLALIRLPAEQWRGFAAIVAVLFVVLFAGQARVQGRLWEPLVRCLDRLNAGTDRAEDRRVGFAAAANLPYRTFVWGSFWWALGGALVAGGMKLLYAGLPLFSAVVMISAALSGGVIMMVFHYFLMKRSMRPVTQALAARLDDPEERGALVQRVPVATKLRVSIAGVTILTACFAILLAEVRSSRPIERQAARLHGRLLDSVALSIADGGAPALARARERARELGIADHVGVLDAAGAGVVLGELGPLARTELRLLRGAGLERGDSVGFDSPNVFSWRRLPDGRVLVALSLWEPLRGASAESRLPLLALLLVSTGLALGLAYLLAGDVSGATGALRAEAERLSSGDLRPGEAFESEDELGDLARSFQGMARSLRTLVSCVAGAADRVEATSGEMARVSESVASVTQAQVRGIEQTTSSMEAIDAQVRGIAESSQALNVSVEESSSSILELGAAGEELNETASALSERVGEVSSSIEEMVRSVKQVLESTASLSEAATETSTSMDEMATSVREVDASAEETARLGEQVAASADRGREKVRQTIEGMEAIREATETAESVIRSLGGRTKEIGAIVDVIDDVADETNLLALNAAIIAAQAGEHGRAFSVVADEIKDLAERVLASTKEIGGLIRAVQEETSNAMGAIERGTSSVASGVDLSAEAGLSLEEITRASQESVTRIGGIVGAVREQAKAAVHVVELMERVRTGVEAIGSASAEQDRGNEVIHRSSLGMSEVAQQVRATTAEQARGASRIAESVEGVREAVESINASLQEQTAACRSAVEFLEQLSARTRSNEQSAQRLDGAAKGLLRQAETLREDVGRFRL